MIGSASISLSDVYIDFPVFNSASMSLKNRILHTASGGMLDKKHTGIVIVRSLQQINIQLKAGERLGIVGHNGSGKTTLLRVISGIYRPVHGTVRVNGNCISLININLGIDPEATGRENVKLRATMMGISPAQIREQMDEIIDFSGLGEFIEMPFRTYSSGMQLRLAFSVSSCISPQILVMDEWLSTGDKDFKARAEQRMNAIVSKTEILVLASHSCELLSRTCNRVIWLDHGKIIMDGPAEDVLAKYFT